MSLPKKILVPVDFTDPSERALDYAIELAQRLGAEVMIMHAFEIPVITLPDGALLATMDLTAQIMRGAETGLANIVEARQKRGITLKSLIKQEVPWRGILAAVEETGADLIVMGTHGRRGLPRAILGSVAEKIVRTAPCPVLTVHGQESKE